MPRWSVYARLALIEMCSLRTLGININLSLLFSSVTEFHIGCPYMFSIDASRHKFNLVIPVFCANWESFLCAHYPLGANCIKLFFVTRWWRTVSYFFIALKFVEKFGSFYWYPFIRVKDIYFCTKQVEIPIQTFNKANGLLKISFLWVTCEIVYWLLDISHVHGSSYIDRRRISIQV